MLKHVSTGTGVSSPTPGKIYAENYPDTISLNSSSSSGSSSGIGSSISGCDYSITINHNHRQHEDSLIEDGNGSTSRSSSMLSIPGSILGHQDESPAKATTGGTKVVVKIFTRVLCTDVEYKTLSISNHTTCKEIVQLILKKFRLQNRDSNLFYLTLETWIQRTGIPIRSMMALEDDAYPALLQSCYRQKDLKFTLMMRRGTNVKIYHNFHEKNQQPFVNVLISDRTTVQELISLLAKILNLPENIPFDLYEYSPSCKMERKLLATESPVAIQIEWPCRDYKFFQLLPSSHHHPHHHHLNRMTVDHFKRNFKTEFALQKFNNHQQQQEKVLYI